jgi:probable HAF family extracellular repeat protein
MRGDVVGVSNLSGDSTTHAFLWHKGKMNDLGTLPGDVFSLADGINNDDEVVGASCVTEFDCRAVIWREGTITDLNELIPFDSPMFLIEATAGINSLGQIAGLALQISSGEIHAFLATPRDDADLGSQRPTSNLTRTIRTQSSSRLVKALEG